MALCLVKVLVSGGLGVFAPDGPGVVSGVELLRLEDEGLEAGVRRRRLRLTMAAVGVWENNRRRFGQETKGIVFLALMGFIVPRA